jgi:hypothetical protein
MPGQGFLKEGGQIIQAFPLVAGWVNIDAAAGATYCTAFCCAIDGTFTVTFNDGTTASIAMIAGDVFSIPGGGTVLATGGATFHYYK